MSIRLTVILDLEVVDVDAVIDSSPYNYCKSANAMAKNLIGLRIAPGWTNKSKQAMGNARGCTHLTQLLGPVATTAIQTIASERSQRAESQGHKRPPAFLNSCHTYADTSPVVKLEWPDHYRGTDDDSVTT